MTDGQRPVAVAFARHDIWRGLGLAAGIVTISSLHYVTPPSRAALHEVYNYACYVPIILAAYWYGVWGGVVSAVVTSAAFIPHIQMTWASNPAYTASQYAQVVVFHALGITVGVLASAQRRLTAQYRLAAASLEQANRELRESHEHLRRADRLSTLGEISSGLAHEIGNPLAGLKGALDILASRATPFTPEAEFTEVGRKEVARLERLVREFLAYARPQEPVRRPTNPSELMERVASLLRPEVEQKGLTLVLENAGKGLSFNLDPDQMTQVLLNVVLNAIQASPSGTTVRICAAREGENARIDVVDQGPGIALEHLARVFDPFFTTKARGTGLGLATSQRIVASHGGSITASPASPTGTVVRIQLPLV